MPIRVTTSINTAAIASVKPRASIVVVDPVVAATASAPVALIDYIELVVGASLDTTGRYRYVQEIAVVSDSVRLETSKLFADSFDLADAQSIHADKGLADSVSFSEQVTRTLIFIRSFNDAFGTIDSARFTLSRPLSDALALSDTLARQFTKQLVDAFGTQDFVAKGPSKAVADLISTVDSAVRSTSKRLADSTLTSDAVTQAVTKALADAITTPDQQTRLLAKTLADGVGMNDSAEATDGLLVQFVKSFANVAFATDAMVRAVSAVKTDAVAFTESGSVLNQGYCDPTYFAEDYVGDSRTFS